MTVPLMLSKLYALEAQDDSPRRSSWPSGR